MVRVDLCYLDNDDLKVIETYFATIEYITVCYIRIKGEILDKTGEARCNEYDTFNAFTGRQVALGRALKLNGFSKKERKQIQQAFREYSEEFNAPDRPPRKKRNYHQVGIMMGSVLSPANLKSTSPALARLVQEGLDKLARDELCRNLLY